jgi:23S rRNA pseudouridine2605 synthase
VGRLDLDTSGLLILTNDNDFAERLTNPEFKVPKTYRVIAAEPVTEPELQRLADGVELKDGPTRPATVLRIDAKTFDLTITEGRNRQVRRMLEAIGNQVAELARIAIGELRLRDLVEGQWRDLNTHEISKLRS